MRVFLIVAVFAFLFVGFLGNIPVVEAANQCTGLNCIVPCDGPDCGSCELIKLGNNIITWLVTIMASVIMLVFAWGGMRMVMAGGDMGAVSEGRQMMTNAVIGFIILLAAWLIVDTVMKAFTNESQFGMWHQIQCTTNTTAKIQDPSTVDTTRGTGTLGTASTLYSCAGDGRASCVDVASTKINNCAGCSGGNCTRIINSELASKLEGVGGSWCASSIGLEPSHGNSCHTTYANCIDAVCGTANAREACTPEKARALQDSFKGQNLWPVFELPPGTSQETLKQYRDSGVCAYIESRATGAHFSVYVTRDSGKGQYAVAGGCPQLGT